jgi:hypothetical protein
MATLDTARAAQAAAFSRVRELIGVRPNAVSIISDTHGGFALKVVLPRAPSGNVPSELDDVPVVFDVSVVGPSLLSGDAKSELPAWLRRSQTRRSSR